MLIIGGIYMPDIKKKKEEEKNLSKDKQVEKQKEELAKSLGISLSDIEHVKMEKGEGKKHEFLKFRDPKNRSVRMLEIIDYNTNMNDMFKETQNSLNSIAHSTDEKANARETFEYNAKHKNQELNLLTLQEFRNIYYANKHLKWKNLKTKIRKQILYLLHHKKDLKIEKINVEYGFGIDENGKVIEVEVDMINKQYDAGYASTTAYKDTKTNELDQEDNLEDLSEEFSLNEDDLTEALSNIVVADDMPTITNAEPIKIKGETINYDILLNTYQYPETLDEMNLTNKQKAIYVALHKAINKKKEAGMQATNSKQYVLTNNHQNNNKEAA